MSEGMKERRKEANRRGETEEIEGREEGQAAARSLISHLVTVNVTIGGLEHNNKLAARFPLRKTSLFFALLRGLGRSPLHPLHRKKQG